MYNVACGIVGTSPQGPCFYASQAYLLLLIAHRYERPLRLDCLHDSQSKSISGSVASYIYARVL